MSAAPQIEPIERLCEDQRSGAGCCDLLRGCAAWEECVYPIGVTEQPAAIERPRAPHAEPGRYLLRRSSRVHAAPLLRHRLGKPRNIEENEDAPLPARRIDQRGGRSKLCIRLPRLVRTRSARARLFYFARSKPTDL